MYRAAIAVAVPLLTWRRDRQAGDGDGDGAGALLFSPG